MTWPRPRSLLGQFVLLYGGVALAAAIASLWSASMLLHQTADHFQRNLLRRQAALSVASIGAGAGSGARAAQPVVLSNGMAVSTIAADRRVGKSYGPPRPAILAVAPLDRTAHFFRVGAVEGYSVPAARGWIVVSQDDADPEVITDDIVRSFLPRFALVTLPTASLLPLIGVLLARRLTLRMRAVSAIAATIGPRTLATRLPRGVLPLEAEPLAEATNAALDRLADALRVQSAFAADVSHELRTPLAVIRLRADALADAAARAGMMAAVDRAARVITQLLALAELELPLGFDKIPVDLRALAEDVVAERAPAIFAGGRSIALEGVADVPSVRGYEEAIRLALENLIDNAAKYTAPGTAIVVEVGPGAHLGVSDDGAALPDEDLARLKDRLWRGTSGLAEGSGIGLSIVERIARAHDGALSVERCSDARGLMFRISLNDSTA